MILRTSVLALAVSFATAASFAQQAATQKPATENSPPPPEIYRNPNAQPQQIFYKWYVHGRAHYAKYAPRGVKNVIRINGQGMLVSERPDNNTFAVLRPVRPTAPNEQAADKNRAQPLPEGTITREQRCAAAQNNISQLDKPKVFEDDGNGNLVPLSADQISQRRQQAQGIIDQFCGPQPSAGNVPSGRPQVSKPPMPASPRGGVTPGSDSAGPPSGEGKGQG